MDEDIKKCFAKYTYTGSTCIKIDTTFSLLTHAGHMKVVSLTHWYAYDFCN